MSNSPQFLKFCSSMITKKLTPTFSLRFCSTFPNRIYTPSQLAPLQPQRRFISLQPSSSARTSTTLPTPRFSPQPTLFNTNFRSNIAISTTSLASLTTLAKLTIFTPNSIFTTSTNSVFTIPIDEETETPEEEMSHIPHTVRFTEESKPAFVQSDEAWQKQLTADEYYVLRKAETEARFRGYTDTTDDGTYHCKGCKAPLYSSAQKFDSGCGWPAFDDCFDKAVTTRLDPDGMRVEIICSNCHSHLGHVFTGEKGKDSVRHCVNSCCLTLQPVTDDE